MTATAHGAETPLTRLSISRCLLRLLVEAETSRSRPTGSPVPRSRRESGAILADPKGVLPFTGKIASEGEIAYARFAGRTPHIVLSRKLDKVAWKNTEIVRDVAAIRRLKQESGKDMDAVGGATLVESLLNQGLIDEFRLVVHPVVLGGGKARFKDVKKRHALKFVEATPLKSGLVRLTYGT